MNTSHLTAIMMAGILMTVSLTAPAYSAVQTFSGDKGAVATIELATCGLDLGAGSLDFGTLLRGSIAPADISPAIGFTYTNTGNIAQGATIIGGSDWDNADPDITQVILSASATHWSISNDQDYADMNAVNVVTDLPGGLAPGASASVYFRLQADVVTGQEGFSGDVQQTLGIVTSC